VNRLKHVVSPDQSAFILGRLISNNVFEAYETLHSMQTRMWGRMGFMALKLDMSKAYDWVEWVFLKALMIWMGLDLRWVRLIMQCIKTVRYSILINGQPVGNICPTKGIRQGDPLSPYCIFYVQKPSVLFLIKQKQRVG